MAVNARRGCCKNAERDVWSDSQRLECGLTAGHPGWEDRKCSSCKNWAIISGLLWSSVSEVSVTHQSEDQIANWICCRMKAKDSSKQFQSARCLLARLRDCFSQIITGTFWKPLVWFLFSVSWWRQSYSAGFSCNRRSACHFRVRRFCSFDCYEILWGQQMSNRNGFISSLFGRQRGGAIAETGTDLMKAAASE